MTSGNLTTEPQRLSIITDVRTTKNWYGTDVQVKRAVIVHGNGFFQVESESDWESVQRIRGDE